MTVAVGGRFSKFGQGSIQGSAKRWALGCVNSRPAARGSQEAGFTQPTVCPKVPYISKVPLFSAKCGWILKPFGLLIAHTLRFDMVYEVA